MITIKIMVSYLMNENFIGLNKTICHGISHGALLGLGGGFVIKYFLNFFFLSSMKFLFK